MMYPGKRILPIELGRIPHFTSPGCYPVMTIVETVNRFHKSTGVWCPNCANLAAWAIPTPDEHEASQGFPYDEHLVLVCADVNYEDNNLTCDMCEEKIDCAYPSDEPSDDEEHSSGDRDIDLARERGASTSYDEKD